MKPDHRVLCCIVAWLCCAAVKCHRDFYDGNIFEENTIGNYRPERKDDNTFDTLMKGYEAAMKPYRPMKGDDESCEETCGLDSGLKENKEVKCLEGDNFECECKNLEHKFDYEQVKCRECDCGKGLCKFEKSIKVCECDEGDAEKNGKCEACDCGENADSCSFEGDVIKCACKANFAQKDDKCEPCDCGENADSCKFEGDVIKCACKANFAQKDDKCEQCECEDNTEPCKFEGDDTKCDCKPGFEKKNGKCEACDCGTNTESCHFEEERKVCNCKEGFAEFNGICKDEKCEICGNNSDVTCRANETVAECDCAVKSKKFDYSRKECRITCDADAKCKNGAGCTGDEGVKFCACLEGTSGDTCSVVDDCVTGKYKLCKGDKGNCTYSGDKEEAECKCKEKKSFKEKVGYCEACDCGENAESCHFEDEKKVCDCKDEFVDIKGKCEDERCEMCGINPDVTCNLSETDAKCDCSEKTKKFDYIRKECRITCDEDANCKNGADCTEDKGVKFCACFEGTSGDTCSVIDDCVTGKYKLCKGNKGNCTYNEDKEEAECKCKEKKSFKEKVGYCEACDCGENADSCHFEDEKKVCDCKDGFADIKGKCEDARCEICGINPDVKCNLTEPDAKCDCSDKTKKFDYTRKECRRTCDKSENCANGAKCTEDEGGKFCSCLKRTSGDDCSVVEDCETGKYKLCKEDKGNCTYIEDKQEAMCVCQEKKILKANVGYCEECVCGEHSNKCSFVEDKKICDCKKGYADKNGNCEECSCGEKADGCSFVNGQKTCACKAGFAQKGEKCEECSCGKQTDKCSFVKGQKQCVCKAGFVEKNGKCEECNCGEHSKKCTFVNGKKTCACNAEYSEKQGTCEECKCGENSKSCRFEGDDKKCDCKDKFGDKEGKCEACGCGDNSKGCVFEEDGKTCNCSKGYGDKSGTCTECKCGTNSIGCTFDGDKITCDCKSLYANKDGTCKECGCGSYATGCTFEDDKKTCGCKKGYGDKDGKCAVDYCVKKCNFDPEKDEVECDGDHFVTAVKCNCKDGDLKFDEKEKKCRTPCSKETTCDNGAKCEKRGEHEFCACLDGTEGYECDVVKDCKSGGKYEKCNGGDKGDCKYNKDRKKAECKCSVEKKLNEKDGFCDDACQKNADCKDGKICTKGVCACEEGKTGEGCKEATGCTKDFKKACNDVGAECIFDGTADEKATCKCKADGMIYDKEDKRCTTEFCRDSSCKAGDCQFDPTTITDYCKCPSGKYYDYKSESCADPDKCLLRKTPCKENEECKEGKCQCKYDIVKDKCVQTFCKPGSCFSGANCTETDGSCFCDKGKIFTGEKCDDGKCVLPGYEENCDCPTGTSRKGESKTCEPSKGKSCDKKCGYGLCVDDNCKCFGYAEIVNGTCVLKANKVCASSKLTADLSKCNCTGMYKQAKDGITCELVTCSDEAAKKDCKFKGAKCEMQWTGKSKQYVCKCHPGYNLDSERGICTDPCSDQKEISGCLRSDSFCYNSKSTVNSFTGDCECPPPFRSRNGKCDELVDHVHMIKNIPVLKEKYEMKDGIDHLLLNVHLIESLRQMFSIQTFDYGYLDDYAVNGDVINCSVWIRFKKDPGNGLKRIKFQAQTFPNGTCVNCSTDTCLWPPNLLLSEKDKDKVRYEKLDFCSEAIKDKLCGKEAKCENKKCYCPRGFKTLAYTIRESSDFRIQRCEATTKTDLDECAIGTHKCSENTTCVKIPGDYICSCKPGYKKTTENDKSDCFDLCTPSPCGKGTCSMQKTNFNCKCQPGYGGSLCDVMDLNYASAKKSTVVVGAVLGTILIVGIIAFFLYYRKVRRSSYSEDFIPAPRQDHAAEMMERRPMRGAVNKSYE